MPTKLQPMITLLLRSSLLLGVAVTVTSCGTVSDMVTSNVPSRANGRPSVVVKLREQQAYLYAGGRVIASSRVSSGREGHSTPTGNYRIIRKDQNHRSSVYGDYVDASGKIVKANVDVRKSSRPRGSHYLGAPMPFFMEFLPSYGLHAGYLPGVPASHGCIRMPWWKARQFYRSVHIGTRVTVKS